MCSFRCVHLWTIIILQLWKTTMKFCDASPSLVGFFISIFKQTQFDSQSVDLSEALTSPADKPCERVIFSLTFIDGWFPLWTVYCLDKTLFSPLGTKMWTVLNSESAACVHSQVTAAVIHWLGKGRLSSSSLHRWNHIS